MKNGMMAIVMVCLGLSGITAHAADQNANSFTGKVFFIAPKDGATVAPEFVVKFGVKGMKIKPAGEIVEGTGHHHLIIDGGPVPAHDIVGKDETHLHYGKGQTEDKLKLTPGPHKLTLQFADGAHGSYGESMSATINVTVK